MTIAHPYINDADYVTDDFAIGDLPLAEGDRMIFHFDFGDDWLFDVELEKVASPKRKPSPARIVASQGKAPPQYAFD